jgi:hypothetical protein
MERRFGSGVYGAVALSAILWVGCLEVETTSHVQPDGRIERVVVVSGDSAEVAAGDFLVPVDAGWSVLRETTTGQRVVLTFRKMFDADTDLNLALAGERGKTLPVTVRLEKRFRWFMTEYRYEETCGRLAPFDMVPVTEYISPSELDLYFRHEIADEPFTARGDSLALDDAGKRFELWDARNTFEAFFQELRVGIERLQDPTVPVAAVDRRKDELFEKAFRAASMRQSRPLVEAAARVLGSDGVLRTLELNRDGFGVFDRQLAFFEKVARTGLKAHVAMPGIITSTNASSIEGNLVTWKDYKEYCYVRDFTMWAESNMINWWAVILTGVVVLLLAVMFTVAAMRRGRGAKG